MILFAWLLCDFCTPKPFVLSPQVFADATLIFPLLVAETFAAQVDQKTNGEKME